MMPSELTRLSGEQYALLTTFRRSGDSVTTPVWIARLDNDIVVWTERTAGKVKRIRNNDRVELTACDLRGNRTHGATVTGTARVLDAEDSRRVRDAIGAKYGIIGRVTMFFSRVRGGTERTVGVAIRLDQNGTDP